MEQVFDLYVNEYRHANKGNDESKLDRKQFVKNLGLLLSQTTAGRDILDCYLDDKDFVHLSYGNGRHQVVNVRLDSYLGIVLDVARGLQNRA